MDFPPSSTKSFGQIYLLSFLNFAFDNGGMSITQRGSIIELIPKKDAELYFIKNWRPLSLLNTDYKIAAKAIANRIKSVLPNVINNDQTGFLKGRFIGRECPPHRQRHSLRSRKKYS